MALLTLLSPGAVAGQSYQTRNGNFVSDLNGLVTNVPPGLALADLIEGGCIPLAYSPNANPRNFVDGGDFSVNPWQRAGTSLFSSGVLSTAITGATPVYGPDRFFAVGSGASPSVLFTQLADVTVPGFTTSCQVSRSSGNTNVSPIYFGQVFESADSWRAQAQNFVTSFWARAAANYSGGNLTAQLIASIGGVNQSAATLIAGSWTGQTVVATLSQALSPAMARYSFNAVVPAGATQLAVLWSWTPTGTAGAADGVIFNGIQAEVGSVASPFEHEDVAVVLEECQRYAYFVPEPNAGVFVAGGNLTSATSGSINLPLQVQMWRAPSVTVGIGLFKIAAGGTSYTPTALTPNPNHTVANAGITATISGGTSGQGLTLVGGGGAGYLGASADF